MIIYYDKMFRTLTHRSRFLHRDPQCIQEVMDVTFTYAANARLWADCCYIQEHEHVLTCRNVCKKKINSKITIFDYLWLTLKLIVEKKS